MTARTTTQASHPMPPTRTLRLAAAALMALSLLGPIVARAAVDPDPATAAESDRLFHEGKELMTQGKIAQACEKFERSLELWRRGGTVLNLALCREAAGELPIAYPLFEEALEFALRDSRDEREQTAREHLEDLQSKLSWLELVLAAGADVPGLTITINGAVLPREQWSRPVPLMRGAHVVAASAPRGEPFEVRVRLAKAGQTQRVEIPVLRGSGPSSDGLSSGGRSGRDGGEPKGLSLSHKWQFGAIARLDVDPIHPGARGVTGLTFGLGDHFEIGASALLGQDVGIEPQTTFFILGHSAYKPFLNAGIPIFFSDGGQAGIRGSAGFAWDVNRHYGLFMQLGAAYFMAAPPEIERAVFLPSLGIQGRL